MTGDLIDTGILTPDRGVIDIGCGPGLFAAGFAASVRSVLCVDSSAAMLELVRQRAAAAGIGSIRTLHARWEDLDPVHRTEVAFTSLCPPLNHPEALLRFEGFASEACVYISSANRDIGVTAGIWRRLGKDYSMGGYDTAYPCRFLEACGRRPELRFYTERTETVSTADEAIAAALKTVSPYLGTGEDVVGAVTDEISSHESDGVVRIGKEMRMGMLVWEPPA